jgi:SAM-dependent methyltransferase
MNHSPGGFIYKLVIDPILRPLHTRIQSMISGHPAILDVACGTGALSFLLAGTARRVVGIDISDSMLCTANRTKQQRSITNVDFVQADATRPLPFGENEFDLALMSMGLHQFQFSTGCMILKEMKKSAREIILLDYAVPFPENRAGLIARFFEVLGGKEHNTHFKIYIKNGGLHTLISGAGLKKDSEIITRNKIFSITACH